MKFKATRQSRSAPTPPPSLLRPPAGASFGRPPGRCGGQEPLPSRSVLNMALVWTRQPVDDSGLRQAVRVFRRLSRPSGVRVRGATGAVRSGAVSGRACVSGSHLSTAVPPPRRDIQVSPPVSKRSRPRHNRSRIRPQIRRDNPLNLSISVSGGKETNQDSPSSGERRGKSPAPNPRPPSRARDMWRTEDCFPGVGVGA